MIDPTAAGTALAMCNMGHGACETMVAREGYLRGTKTAALITTRRVHAGEELLWDYRAVTDDPGDPLLDRLCRLRCGRARDGQAHGGSQGAAGTLSACID